MNLNELRLFLWELIQNSEFADKSYFAGGCVRDFILNPYATIKSDVDICVELPEGGIALAQYLQNRLQPSELVIHKSFGTASLHYKNLQLEFVATRKEQYFAGNRYPKVEFGTLTDDVLRRDFTINA
ncbi:MAG TPA: CCA tRNA nucleotidyltransferase, partial [Candidatus Cloacimonas sp.]|nr:CCA tRNA nucleotidyltransferase [Candidatus Cloacimonas sp.]